jgi:hypothetical protein
MSLLSISFLFQMFLIEHVEGKILHRLPLLDCLASYFIACMVAIRLGVLYSSCTVNTILEYHHTVPCAHRGKRLECKEMTSTFLSQNLTFWNLHFFASTGAIFQATLVKTLSWIRNINLPEICLNRNKNIRLLM